MGGATVRQDLFVPAGDGARLLGSRCPACGRYAFPAQVTCPYCSGEGCTTAELSGCGHLELCTTVTKRPPGYAGPLPFGFGVVALPEGLRVISRIWSPERLRPGDPVRCVLETLSTEHGNDLVIYAFAPAEP